MTELERASYENELSTRRSRQCGLILSATRRLFDETGRADASITAIAHAAGVNRSTLYKHFTGREEISALVLVAHVDDLRDRLSDLDDPEAPPTQRLRTLAAAFYEYSLANLSYIECARSILRLTNEALDEEISPEALRTIAQSMTRVLAVLVDVLDAGVEAGEFSVPDTNFVANLLYNQAFGALNLARLDPWVIDVHSAMPQHGSADFRAAIPSLVEAAVATARG